MPIADDEENGPLEHQLELLTDVELVSFTATPSALGPFGVSLLQWEVKGVKPGVQIRLDFLQVPAISQRSVRPVSSHAYHLGAAAGPARKALGTVVVKVDTSSCTEIEISRAFELMRNLLFNVINNEPTTYWSGAGSNHRSVTEESGQIRFRMVFRKKISGPDLWITCGGTFGLRVEDGQLVSFGEVANGAAEFPKYWGFLTGFLGGLALAVNEANAKALAQAHEFIQGLVAFLNLLSSSTQGKTPRTVEVTRRNGLPVVLVVQCSDQELQIFAHALAASANLSLTALSEPRPEKK